MHRLLGQTARLNEACGRPSRGLGNSPAAVKVSADYRLARSQDAAHDEANPATRCKAAGSADFAGETFTSVALASGWRARSVKLDYTSVVSPLQITLSKAAVCDGLVGVLHG